MRGKAWRLSATLVLLVAGELGLSACGDDDAVCGDGAAEGEERCDGDDLRGETCESLGYFGGSLACTATCTFDASACDRDVCAAFGLYGDGVYCDACEAYGGSPDPDCAALCGQADGRCSPPTYYSLEALAWTCELAGYPDPDCGTCGNGVAEAAEECDGTDLRGTICDDLGVWWLNSGELRCAPDCVFDLTGCE